MKIKSDSMTVNTMLKGQSVCVSECSGVSILEDYCESLKLGCIAM